MPRELFSARLGCGLHMLMGMFLVGGMQQVAICAGQPNLREEVPLADFIEHNMGLCCPRLDGPSYPRDYHRFHRGSLSHGTDSNEIVVVSRYEFIIAGRENGSFNGKRK